MDISKFRELLDVHGADLENWPRAVSGPARELLEQSESARALLEQQREVETLVASMPLPATLAGLQARVLRQPLPSRQRLLDRVLGWLLPETSLAQDWGRSALAATLPLVFGVLVGNYFSFGIVAEDLETWNWDDELVMLSLVSPVDEPEQP